MTPTRHPRPSLCPAAGRRRRSPGRPRSGSTPRSGFTLVELLVVIGIIVILMSILLPAVGKARVQAQGARTRATMNSISSAIERYYNDHRSYPGVIPNARMKPATGSDITSSENLVLTLAGGFRYNETTPADPVIALDDVGKGPLFLSPSPVKRVRKPAYIDVAPGTLLSVKWSPTDSASGAVNGGTNPLEQPGIPPTGATTDSAVPEFVDDYSNPRPILYLRANVGGAVVPDPSPPTATPGKYDTDAKQYNIEHLYPYGRTASGDFKGDFVFPNNDTDDNVKNDYEYLRHPSIANTPRGKDKFILISAGPDRRYATKDDILIGG